MKLFAKAQNEKVVHCLFKLRSTTKADVNAFESFEVFFPFTSSY